MLSDLKLKMIASLSDAGFVSIKPEDYDLFAEYEKDSQLIERTALNVISWIPEHNGLYKIIEGYLCCVFIYSQKPPFFTIYKPIKPGFDNLLDFIVDALFQITQNISGFEFQIRYIPEEHIEEYRKIQKFKSNIFYLDSEIEYVLNCDEFLSLKGGKNKNKSRRIKKFINDGAIAFLPVDRSNIGCCLEIEEKWCEGKNCAVCSSPNGCEKNAVVGMMNLFDEKKHCGLISTRDGVLTGYIIIEIRDETSAFMFFGKSLENNFFAYIIYETIKRCMTKAVFFNIDADLGIEGLRRFKSGLNPAIFRKKYVYMIAENEV
ncbi:MAG: phosphatidylglycerol lysyltransferase domain-containing protein [Spirochaetaceae bacterium]|jgi:hypothetical protein|nr:phosphatidylglycerol lysyltransferase domain-containing protein [Spirochaetaceae bacterium]